MAYKKSDCFKGLQAYFGTQESLSDFFTSRVQSCADVEDNPLYYKLFSTPHISVKIPDTMYRLTPI